MRRTLPALLALILVMTFSAALFAPRASADEGMWTFDNFPSAAVKAKYGVDVDQAWLDRVRAATAHLSIGCSSSIVTNTGLILSNRHCVDECEQQLSTPTTDYVKLGFMAAGPADEKLCPGLEAEVLAKIDDVTKRVTDAAAGKTGGDFVAARNAAIAAVEKEGCAGKEAQYRCDVVTLYQGGQYKLYRYRKYTDVRLVFAPEAAIGAFGGDPDNFNFPRYDLDCSFMRLYENGRPVSTPDHLHWSTQPPQQGALVFVAGGPQGTQRLLTTDQLMTLRDLIYPDVLIRFSEMRGELHRFAAESPEHARISGDLLEQLENSFKVIRGEEQSLVDPSLIATKRAADHELRTRAAKDPKLAAATGNPWEQIAKAQERMKVLYYPYSLIESGAGFGSELFPFARDLVRAAQERAKPNGERLPEYTDSRLGIMAKQLLDPQPVYPELEQLTLRFWLSKLRENLTADSPYTHTFLGKDSPETLAARLAASKVADPAFRKALWDGGLAAVQSSDDPLIRYVLATDAASRTLRKQYEAEVSGPVAQAAQKIGHARFAVYGTSIYPDGTLTPRVSYGKVEGWTDHGTTVPPFTYFGGLWQRATGQPPFELPPRWQNAQGKVDPNMVFNFTSDNDITGGNSGSPTFDFAGNVVGTAFDGNIDSLGGAFIFDDRINRTVSVSTAAITEALRNVYAAQSLVQELTTRE